MVDLCQVVLEPGRIPVDAVERREPPRIHGLMRTGPGHEQGVAVPDHASVGQAERRVEEGVAHFAGGIEDLCGKGAAVLREAAAFAEHAVQGLEAGQLTEKHAVYALEPVQAGHFLGCGRMDAAPVIVQAHVVFFDGLDDIGLAVAFHEPHLLAVDVEAAGESVFGHDVGHLTGQPVYGRVRGRAKIFGIEIK